MDVDYSLDLDLWDLYDRLLLHGLVNFSLFIKVEKVSRNTCWHLCGPDHFSLLRHNLNVKTASVQKLTQFQ